MWALPWRPLFGADDEPADDNGDSAGDLILCNSAFTSDFCSDSVSIASIGIETQSNEVSDDNSLLLSVCGVRKEVKTWTDCNRMVEFSFFFLFHYFHKLAYGQREFESFRKLLLKCYSPVPVGSSIPLQSNDTFHGDISFERFEVGCISQGVSEPQHRDAFQISNWANNVAPAWRFYMIFIRILLLLFFF